MSRSGRIASRGHEIEHAVSIHTWNAFQRSRINACDFALVVERQVIYSCSIVKICVHGGLVQIVEEEILAIFGDKWLHRVSGITMDRHTSGVVETCIGRTGRHNWWPGFDFVQVADKYHDWYGAENKKHKARYDTF